MGMTLSGILSIVKREIAVKATATVSSFFSITMKLVVAQRGSCACIVCLAHQKKDRSVTQTGAKFQSRLKHKLLRMAIILRWSAYSGGIAEVQRTSDESLHFLVPRLIDPLLPLLDPSEELDKLEERQY